MERELHFSFFESPEEKIKELKEELDQSLPASLNRGVNSFINFLVQKEMKRIDENISEKLFSITNEIESDWKKDKFTSFGKKEAMKEFLQTTNPTKIIQLLNQSLNVNHAKKAYSNSLNKIAANNCFPTVLKRYQVSDYIFAAFSHQIAKETEFIISPLKVFKEDFVRHMNFLGRCAEESGRNSAVSAGAGLVGSLTGIPLGGFLARKAVSAFTNMDTYIEGSFNDLRKKWKRVVSTWEQMKKELERDFYLLYTILIGGYFIKIAKDYESLGYKIIGINIVNFKIRAIVKESEQKRLIHWLLENERLIGEALASGNFTFAHNLTKNLIQFFKENPYAGKVTYTINKQSVTLLELAYLYRYGVYMFFIEELYWKKGEYSQAAQMYKELLEKLKTKVAHYNNIRDKKIISIHDMLFRMMMVAVRENQFTQLIETFAKYNEKKLADEFSRDLIHTFNLFTGTMEDHQLPYGEICKAYQRLLHESGIKSDSFLSFLKRRNFINKLGILSLNRGIRHSVDSCQKAVNYFWAGVKKSALHIIAPVFLIVWIGFNYFYFANYGFFFPMFIDQFYFEKIEGKLLYTNLDELALGEATRTSNIKRGIYLLENTDVDPSSLNEYGSLFINSVVINGSIKELQKLIDLGVNLNAVDGDGLKPLLVARQEKKWEAFSLLLKNGAKP